jgi:predicted lipoprotein with Yx(FWY)xxD motif
MFRFLKDGHNKSRCNRSCRSVWPPVMTTGKPRAGSHVHGSHLGRTKNGQVSYYGHPLYYFSQDHKPGKTHGDGFREFGAHWYVVSPAGKSVKPKHKPTGGATSPAEVASGTAGAAAVITNGADGHTLYELVPNERPNFWCTGSCTATWPPLLTKGSPTASGDAMSAKLGTVKRPDGSTQVTYDDFPVYEYSGDSAAGQANGQGVAGPYFNTWYDINPDGSHN